MQLKENSILTMKDLSNFFNISYTNIKTNKDKYFQLLENYADFTLNKTKVTINKVYKDTYEKEDTAIPLTDWTLEQILKYEPDENGYRYGTASTVYLDIEEKVIEWRKKMNKKPWSAKYGARQVSKAIQTLLGKREIKLIDYEKMTEEEKSKIGTKMGVCLKKEVIKEKSGLIRKPTIKERELIIKIWKGITVQNLKELVENESFLYEYLSNEFDNKTFKDFKKHINDTYDLKPYGQVIKEFKEITQNTLIGNGSVWHFD